MSISGLAELLALSRRESFFKSWLTSVFPTLQYATDSTHSALRPKRRSRGSSELLESMCLPESVHDSMSLLSPKTPFSLHQLASARLA